MRMQNVRIFLVACILPFLASCADNPSLFALPHDPTLDQARTALSKSFNVGEVHGGTVLILNPNGISGDQYGDALSRSLRANQLLADDPSTAKYLIDAKLDFDLSGIFEKHVDTTVAYRVLSTT